MISATRNQENSFDDDDWDLLIDDIDKHNVVPIVGPDLLIKGTDESQTLHEYLVTELISRLCIDTDRLPANCALLDLCSHIDSRDRNDAIRKAIQAGAWPTPRPLAQLGAISGFDFYVSTTFDSLLCDAVRQARAGAETRIYGLKRPHSEADITSGRLLAPVVFHMYGLLDGTADCALSEEEILQFTQRLQDPSYRPPHAFDLLARRNLLFLGCSFPGWLGRFFRSVLKVSGDLRDQGLFVDRNITEDPGYVLFLKRQGTKLWLADSGVSFVAELYRRWNKRHPKGESAPIFISYATEDMADAQTLSDLFRQEGISAWLDRKELQSGEIWRSEIEQAIQDCKVFIPLVSRNSVRATHNKDRYVGKEYDLVQNMPGKRVCPLRLDFTSVPRFAHFQTRTIEEIPELVRDVKSFLRGSERGTR